MRVVTFKIDEELLQKLDVYALNMRLSRSDVIREAIEQFLRAKEEERTVEGFKKILAREI